MDLARNVLAVRHTLGRGEGGALEFGEPKTAAGRRSIAVPDSVVKALKRHKSMQAKTKMHYRDVYQDQGIVFATPEGKPIHPNNLTRWFRELCEAAGVPHIRIHDKRHTSATLTLT